MCEINPQQGGGKEGRYDPDAGPHIHGADPVLLGSLLGKGLKGADVGEQDALQRPSRRNLDGVAWFQLGLRLLFTASATPLINKTVIEVSGVAWRYRIVASCRGWPAPKK